MKLFEIERAQIDKHNLDLNLFFLKSIFFSCRRRSQLPNDVEKCSISLQRHLLMTMNVSSTFHSFGQSSSNFTITFRTLKDIT